MLTDMRLIGADEFVGYIFKYGAPPKRSRLWFIERELRQLCPEQDTVNTLFKGGDKGKSLHVRIKPPNSYGLWVCHVPENRRLQDTVIRWESNEFTAIWKLTNTIIPHIHTFGYDDDVWRLGLWPD